MTTTMDKAHKPLTKLELDAYLKRCAIRRANLAEAHRMLITAAATLAAVLESARPEMDEQVAESQPDVARSVTASPVEPMDAYQHARSHLSVAQRSAAKSACAAARADLIASVGGEP